MIDDPGVLPARTTAARAWLLAFAALDTGYLTGLGLLTTDEPVLWLTAAYLAATGAVTGSLLRGLRTTPAVVPPRFAPALLAWGVAFAAVVVLGLLLFRGEPGFWLPGALLCAVPLLAGAARR